MDSSRRSRSFRAQAAASCQFRFSVSADRRVLKRNGERLASESDQSDVYVCPEKGAGRHEAQGSGNCAELLIKQLDVLGALEQWSAAPAQTS
jgi:hypothetical protein